MSTTSGEQPSSGGPRVLDGRRLRDEMVAGLREVVAAAGWPPVRLATVLVGADAVARRQAGYKHEAARRAGMRFTAVELSSKATQAQVADSVRRLADDPGIHGVFVQLPLPAQVDAPTILDVVAPAKDVDGLSSPSLGHLLRGRPGHVPAAAASVLRLLERYGIATQSRRAVVVAPSSVSCLAIALLLGRKGVDATVTLVHPGAPDLADVCRTADILVASAAAPRLITAEHIGPGATVVDLTGDVDLESASRRAGTMVPKSGGTGPVTVACLLEHTLDAARRLGAFPPATTAP